MLNELERTFYNIEGSKPSAEKCSDTNKNANIENRDIRREREREMGEAGRRAAEKSLQKCQWIMIRKVNDFAKLN